jgi:hypothetical protein
VSTCRRGSLRWRACSDELSFSAIKQFDFSWAAVPGAEFYQLLESPALGEPFLQIGEDIEGDVEPAIDDLDVAQALSSKPVVHQVRRHHDRRSREARAWEHRRDDALRPPGRRTW